MAILMSRPCCELLGIFTSATQRARQSLQVVGAGRGPLVRAALSAARRTGRLLKVYAIEKNPNAVVTLHKLVAAERSGTAQICSAEPLKHASSCICNPAHAC